MVKFSSEIYKICCNYVGFVKISDYLCLNYPEPKFAGPTPAYGLYARHVEGLHVDGLSVFCQRPDSRPVVLLDDVSHATIKAAEAENQPVLSSDVVTYDCSDIRVLD